MKFVKPTLLVILALLLISALWITIFPHEASRIFVNQRRAVLSIGDVHLAQRNYAERHPEAGYACKLTDLGQQGVEDLVFADGTKSGYHFELRCLQQGSQKTPGYTITAEPSIPGTTGEFALCGDQTGEIWYSPNGAAADCLATHKPVGRKYR